MSLRDAWTARLGPAADDQINRLDAAAAEIARRWPDPDLADTRQQAIAAAAQIILGGDTRDTLEAIARPWHDARRLERDRHAALTGALIASATGARSGPGSEADLIRRSGASRMTVRKALGR